MGVLTPLTITDLWIGRPPGRVPIPRGWASGERPETSPYDSGGVSSVPALAMFAGMLACATLNRLASVTSLAVLLGRPLATGWRMLSRLLASIFERSTGGVNGIPGGKCPLIPTGA